MMGTDTPTVQQLEEHLFYLTERKLMLTADIDAEIKRVAGRLAEAQALALMEAKNEG